MAIGPVAWFGLLSAGALILVFSLPYAPRAQARLALFSLTRCKLAEVETIDEIPCPGVGIDTVIIPGWDNQPDD